MTKKLSLLLIAGLALVGCTTTAISPQPNLSYGIATTGDFSFLPAQGVATYAWRPDSAVARVSDNVDGEKYLKVIKHLIDNELASKGYIQVSSSQRPNMFMDFGIATESGMNDQEIFESTQISTGIKVDAEPGEEGEKGSVYVAAFAPVGDFPRWRVLAQGPTEGRIDDPNQQHEMERIITSMLNLIPSRAN